MTHFLVHHFDTTGNELPPGLNHQTRIAGCFLAKSVTTNSQPPCSHTAKSGGRRSRGGVFYWPSRKPGTRRLSAEFYRVDKHGSIRRKRPGFSFGKGKVYANGKLIGEASDIVLRSQS